MKRKTILEFIIGLILVIFFFTIMSFISRTYLSPLTNLIREHYFLGIIFFILFEIIVIIIAPLSSIPTIPILTETYGFAISFFVLFIGDVIGSLIAFIIAKKLGKRIVSKFVSLKNSEEIIELIPKREVYISLIVLRIVIPADILSYTLGIFTKISYKIYIITLIIGTIPGALFFAYLGGLPILGQLIGWAIGIILAVILFLINFRKRLKLKKS